MRMSLRLACLMAFAAVLAGAQRPELSGEWVRVDSTPGRSVAAAGDAAFRRGDMGSGWSATVGIAQRADSLIIEYDFFSSYDLQPRVRLAYALNGAESRNGVMLGHSEYAQRARLAWQDNVLVITTIHSAPKGAEPVEVRQALSLDASGALVVDVTRGANTVRTTYRRK
jgi:hypothetical protein